MTDRINPPAWKVQEDPSDLPRIRKAMEETFRNGDGVDLSPLDLAVLERWIRGLKLEEVLTDPESPPTVVQMHCHGCLDPENCSGPEPWKPA